VLATGARWGYPARAFAKECAMGLKMSEILLIMGVLLLLFGGSRLPQLGSALGSAIRNFKRGFGGEEVVPSADDKKPSGTLAGSTPVEKDATARSTSHQHPG
jgi:TatA/E family protein of Tat protein translocase